MAPSGTSGSRLFFLPQDLPRIRANTAVPVLRPLYQTFKKTHPEQVKPAIRTFLDSGDIVYDFPAPLRLMNQMALVHLVEPDPALERTLLEGIRFYLNQPKWDYFLDKENHVLGIQRASYTTKRLLWIREVLGDAIDEDLDQELLASIAEKGCIACFHTLDDMDNWAHDHGWDFDENHTDFYKISMERWPMILGANNLRAAPTAALGMGALALQGQDSRANAWLKHAIDSSRKVLHLFSPDGSYFEGLSYADYTLRTLFSFFEAYELQGGQVDWGNDANLDGVIDFILTMQMGRHLDGKPDIVNYSDARSSVGAGIPSWIGRKTGNRYARWAADHCSNPRMFMDFLWYDSELPLVSPSPALKNVHNDLDWILCRTGWEPNDAYLAFKSGGPANHEHADRNSFIYKYNGERLLNDHFGAAYDWRHDGWPIRLTRGHNCVLIDGKGHTYHDGSEGTNDSQAYATVLNFEDRGGVVWWTSDATAAYLIDNLHVFKVLRTVIFAKPETVILIDQVQLRYRPQTVDLRFYPDNADGQGRISLGPSLTASIRRPAASLSIQTASENGLTTGIGKLDVPPETGDFPFLEIRSGETLNHEIITLFEATRTGKSASIAGTVSAIEGGWRFKSRRLDATVYTTGPRPEVQIIAS